ncbi:conserved hypothetical protein [Histoplasma capsulatum var. duboisii H88]|uniref:Uncharacterized protein n=1 Tax=Ajellomyces capsulatus (strain H88) TaxID=544711 RepID=F0UCJ0_AJEC8|nr:conserved hypothetical protein [Histoplasma capsulatum var. duboisii H88]
MAHVASENQMGASHGLLSLSRQGGNHLQGISQRRNGGCIEAMVTILNYRKSLRCQLVQH